MKGLSIEPESRRVPSYMEMAQRTGLKETYQKNGFIMKMKNPILSIKQHKTSMIMDKIRERSNQQHHPICFQAIPSLVSLGIWWLFRINNCTSLSLKDIMSTNSMITILHNTVLHRDLLIRRTYLNKVN